MLEIIIVVLVSKKIAAMVKEKGRSAGGYVTLFVLLWFGGEIVGAIVGAMMTGGQNAGAGGIDMAVYVFALVGAAVGGITGFAIASMVSPLETRRRRDRDFDARDDRQEDALFEDANASAIRFACPSCGKKLKVPAHAVGKTMRCPGCQATLTVPEQ